MSVRRSITTYNRVNGKTKYDLFLLKLLLADICESAALRDSRYSRSALYDNINKALSQNHIKRFCIMETHGRGKHKLEYYALTKEGLLWLTNQATNASSSSSFLLAAAPWLPYIDYDSFSAVANIKRNPSLSYEVRSGNAFAFAFALGAQSSDFYLTGEPVFIRDETVSPEINATLEEVATEIDEAAQALGLFDDADVLWNASDDEVFPETPENDAEGEDARRSRKTLKTIRGEAVAAMKAQSQQPLQPPCEGIIYIPSREVIGSIPRDWSVKTSDYAFRQYAGLLETDHSCVMLYHAKSSGITWPYLLERRDVTTISRFNYRCSPFPIDTVTPEAAILVNSPRNFQNVITDKHNIRKTDTKFCTQYKSIYIFPHSAEGQALARWILLSSKSDRSSFIAQRVKNLNLSAQNEKLLKPFFGYKSSKDGLPVFDGIEMKIDVITSVDVFRDVNPDVPFGVICLDWQTDYYRTLWPNVQTFIAETPA